MNGYSNTVSLVALSWMALEFTGSPLGVGLVIASRTVPKLVLSLPLGILSDRIGRRIPLQFTNYLGAAMSVVAVVLSMSGGVNIYMVLSLAVIVGALDAAQTTFCKAYVIDVLGNEEAVNGMTMENLANRVFGVIGGISTGLLLQSAGGAATFAAMAASYFLSAAILHAIPGQYMAPDVRSELDASTNIPYLQSVMHLLRKPVVLIFVTIAASAEIFAYSSEVLLPSFAKEIYQVGELGLGTFVSLSNAGGVLALLVMANFSKRINAEKMLLITACAFGLNLVLFAISPTFLIAACVMLFLGMTWSLTDVLLPTALQMGVGHANRGSVMGLWNLSRGFGPLGQLEIGLLATSMGVVFTQMANGLIFFSTSLVMAALYFRYAERSDDSRNLPAEPRET
jgi:MFS family permease